MAPSLSKVTGISSFQKFSEDDLLKFSKDNWARWACTLISRPCGVALARYFDSSIVPTVLSANNKPIFDQNNDFAKSILYDAVSKTEQQQLDNSKTAAEQLEALKKQHLKTGPVRAATLLRSIFTPVFSSDATPAEVIATIHAKATTRIECNAVPKTANEFTLIGALHALGLNHPDIQHQLDTELVTGTVTVLQIEEALVNAAWSTDGQTTNITVVDVKKYNRGGKLLSCWDCGGNHFSGCEVLLLAPCLFNATSSFTPHSSLCAPMLRAYFALLV
jgi:hypothetical protein